MVIHMHRYDILNRSQRSGILISVDYAMEPQTFRYFSGKTTKMMTFIQICAFYTSYEYRESVINLRADFLKRSEQERGGENHGLYI
jgi:hypothetical protein